MFTVALFTLARAWKQLRCPSKDEWINMLWYTHTHTHTYTHTMKYYSDIKRNKFESVEMRWVKLEPVIQIEVNWKEKSKYTDTYIYIEYRKIAVMFCGRNINADIENGLLDKAGEGEWDELRVLH